MATRSPHGRNAPEAMTAGVRLDGITKEYPGVEPSLRGTKLEVKGPALWARNAARLAGLGAVTVPPVRALDQVSLAIGPGEVFAILGPNGSGKTTLMKIIAGLLRPTAGTGAVAGVSLDAPERLRRRVAYASTTGWMGLEWGLTAEENIRFFGRLMGLSRAVTRRRAEEAIQAVGLEADATKAVSQLSNGMRQRVILARALLLRTPVLLLDEPLLGLDPDHRANVLTLVREKWAARGQTVILVDHLADAVETVVDRAALLRQGQVCLVGTPAALLASVHDAEAVEILTLGGAIPSDPPPPDVRHLDVVTRPGPRAVTEWRFWLSRRNGDLEGAVRWIMSGGGEIIQLATRPPRFSDLMADDIGGGGEAG
jgi:ABC-2 type transport system ATP-binding protein